MKDIDAHDSVSLKALAELSAGYPFRGKIDALPEGDVAVIQMRNVDPDTGIDWSELTHVELPGRAKRAYLSSGDIILSTRGGRNFAYFIKEVPGHAVCSPHFFVVRVAPQSDLLPEFLAWQMNQKPAQDYFTANATGSYILNLRREVVEHLRVVVPPIKQQQLAIVLDETVRAERDILNQLIDNRAAELNALALQLLSPKHAFQEQELS